MNDIIYNNKKAVSSKIYIYKKMLKKERLVSQLHRYLIGQDERINVLEAIELVLLNTG